MIDIRGGIGMFKECSQELAEVMENECKLLTQLRNAETELKGSIHAKDWEGLDRVMKQMELLSENLADLESSRHEAYETLRDGMGLPFDATFYQVIVRLPPDFRDHLAELYRTMKFTIFGIQAITYCIDEHVQTINGTMHQILNELYPHRKGNIYSKEGRSRQADSNPLLVNRSL